MNTVPNPPEAVQSSPAPAPDRPIILRIAEPPSGEAVSPPRMVAPSGPVGEPVPGDWSPDDYPFPTPARPWMPFPRLRADHDGQDEDGGFDPWLP